MLPAGRVGGEGGKRTVAKEVAGAGVPDGREGGGAGGELDSSDAGVAVPVPQGPALGVPAVEAES